MKNLSHFIRRLQMLYTRRHEPEYATVFADLYWQLLIFLSVGLVVALCAYSAWQFVIIVTDTPVSSTPPTPSSVLPLNSTTLTNTLANFDARTARFNSVSSLPSISDPYTP